MDPFIVKDLHRIPYEDALSQMLACHERCVNDQNQSSEIWFLEHDPVVTKGRRLQGQMIPGENQLKQKGIQIVEADRGGLLTYHGPGQLVVYFILRLSDYFKGISELVHFIEESLLQTVAAFGVQARVDPEHPGLWVGDKKIGSLGLRVSDGVTRHGLSLNLKTDLSVYQLFDPCGMTGQVMKNLSDLIVFDDQTEWQVQQKLKEILREGLHERQQKK